MYFYAYRGQKKNSFGQVLCTRLRGGGGGTSLWLMLLIIFPSLSFSLVGLLWRVLTGWCCARQSIQIWKRWQGRWNTNELSSSMLAPCDLMAGRGYSLHLRILSQRRLGLATLGVKSPVGQKKQVVLITRCMNAERRSHDAAYKYTTMLQQYW